MTGANQGGWPDTCLLYVFDACCGWCWGISARVMELAQARAAQVKSYPTLPALHEGRATALPGTGTPLRLLVAAVGDWLAERVQP